MLIGDVRARAQSEVPLVLLGPYEVSCHPVQPPRLLCVDVCVVICTRVVVCVHVLMCV